MVYDVDVHSCSVGYIGVARVFDYFMREEKMGVKDMMEIPSGKKRFTTRFLYQNRKDYGYRRAKRSTKILAGIKA
ncbi:MAG TPA: hypothetical protein EYP60_01175 [bacterium (Candidatus Stahlbacteria)]|nr:hypothetical protein [Candidatus Stahlbacteria bacterium]